MGTGYSITETEYAKQVASFRATELTIDNADELTTFLQVSSDFNFVFTSATLDDFRKIMKDRPQNAIHLISHVSQIQLTFKGGKSRIRCRSLAS